MCGQNKVKINRISNSAGINSVEIVILVGGHSICVAYLYGNNFSKQLVQKSSGQS